MHAQLAKTPEESGVFSFSPCALAVIRGLYVICMHQFYKLYRDVVVMHQVDAQLGNDEITHQVDAQMTIFSIPWGHHKLILDRCRNGINKALFFVRKTLENNWSRAVLMNFLDTNFYERRKSCK